MIVAAIETNWNGDYYLLDRMVEECHKCGVDYVKFQALSAEKLDRHPELDWYESASITPDNVKQVDNVCKNNNIKWFCTPYYPEAVDFLDEYVDMYKIRYDDRKNMNIIHACNSTGKKIILATDKPSWFMKIFTDLHQIYCIPKYPTAYGEINFDMIRTMKGYSNHCMDPLAVLKAKRVGAEYIEFHITSDSSKFHIDNKVSFNMGQLQEIMKWIK